MDEALRKQIDAKSQRFREEDRGPETTATVIIFTVLACVCVGLRFFTRFKFTIKPGLEDYFIAVSMCCTIATSVFQVEQVKWGLGRHLATLDLAVATSNLKYLYWSIITYNLSLTLTKVSILLQYRRIFTQKKARVRIYIVMGLCIGYGIIAVFTASFRCIPVDAYWNLLKRPMARCIDEILSWYANASVNVATDLVIAALPVRAIWALQMAKKQKIALVIILSIGWIVCIMSILRIQSLVVFEKHSDDPTWYGAPAAYWSAIEANLAIVCASTPALKPLVPTIIPAFSSRQVARGSANRNANRNRSCSGLLGKPSDSSSSCEDPETAASYQVAALPPMSLPPPGRILVRSDIEQHYGRRGENGYGKRHNIFAECSGPCTVRET